MTPAGLDYPPERDAKDLARRYAERRGLDPLHPESEIVARARDHPKAALIQN